MPNIAQLLKIKSGQPQSSTYKNYPLVTVLEHLSFYYHLIYLLEKSARLDPFAKNQKRKQNKKSTSIYKENLSIWISHSKNIFSADKIVEAAIEKIFYKY